MTRHPPSGDGFLRVRETSFYLSNCVIARYSHRNDELKRVAGNLEIRDAATRLIMASVSSFQGIAFVGLTQQRPQYPL
jgi:hypothetical protein